MSFNFEEFVNKYKPHKETLDFFLARAADGVQPYFEIGVDKARQASIEASEKYGGSVDLDGKEFELTVPSPYNKDGIQVTVYAPSSCKADDSPTILAYFHGGGNVIGCRKTHQTICKIIAKESPCIVVNVEYRLGPEHRFPANHDDAKTLVQWLAKNKAAVGGDAGSRLGVCGDSAGGRISAVVCHEAADIIDFAVLIYPSVGLTNPFPSIEEFKDGPVLSTPIRTWFMENYFERKSDMGTPRASPLQHADFGKLPPTLIIVAELDPLRDGCHAYEEKLRTAGIPVELQTIKGVPHAFWSLTGAFRETGKEAQSYAVDFIRKFKA
ncbi:esterase LipI-like isoform X2 [Mya arenaria]|uniref:esterase LipI-like isoform X2 n=1 Tax=Mya arenaria TaxID=6604 RepID=UPI0022E0B397|nr:esterase LipI-like isoform X2 [Mya arenaria]